MSISLIIGVIAMAALTSFAVAEPIARWWIRYQGQYYIWPPHFRLEMELEPGGFPHLDSHVRFYVNSLGERGDEIPEGSGKLFRVLAAGGSAVEGYFLDQDATWPQVLKRILS